MQSESARALVDDFARHGGRLDLARAAFPEIADWTDLSTGIAPWPYPMDRRSEAAECLPDPGRMADLEGIAAAFFGVAAQRIVAVPGSDLAMRLLGMILAGRSPFFRPAIVRPGYSGHGAMWGGIEATACAIGDIGRHESDHDALMLARPNNPDGLMADRATLEQAALTLASRGGHLIVDEAFADAVPEASLAGAGWPGLIVLRSFGKFFGLPGLRLGFVIAPESICAALRGLIGDWPISGPALATGVAAYGDRAWHAVQRERLAAASQRLGAMLQGHGIELVGRTDFFTLVSLRQRDRLFVHLMQAGVLTRPFAYAPDWLRIGLPRDEYDWARLGTALNCWRTG